MPQKNLPNPSRRSVLKSAVAAGTILPYFPWTSSAKANWSANDKVPIACIGVGGMGRGDAQDAVNQGAEILAVCDVDLRHAEAAAADEKMGKGKADVCQDYREVLERDDIDVVQIVTPDHWHVKIAIEALQAGKHVFCQKPLTLTIEENKLIRAACQKYPDLVFGIGTQQRSNRDLFLRAVNMVQKGLLGDILGERPSVLDGFLDDVRIGAAKVIIERLCVMLLCLSDQFIDRQAGNLVVVSCDGHQREPPLIIIFGFSLG